MLFLFHLRDNHYELLLVKDEKLKAKPDDFNEADYSEKLLNRSYN